MNTPGTLVYPSATLWQQNAYVPEYRLSLYPSAAAADTAAFNGGGFVRIDVPLTLTGPMTFTAPVVVNALITRSTFALTFSRPINAGFYQIFDKAGTGIISFYRSQQAIAEWFGITGNAVTNDTSSIKAISQSGVGEVYFPPNFNYLVDPGQIVLNKRQTWKGPGKMLSSFVGTAPGNLIEMAPDSTVSGAQANAGGRISGFGHICTFTGRTITGVTNANPGTITTSIAHGFTVGQLVTLTGLAAPFTWYNNQSFVVASVPTSFTFTLTGFNTTGTGPYVSGGLVSLKHTTFIWLHGVRHSFVSDIRSENGEGIRLYSDTDGLETTFNTITDVFSYGDQYGITLDSIPNAGSNDNYFSDIRLIGHSSQTVKALNIVSGGSNLFDGVWAQATTASAVNGGGVFIYCNDSSNRFSNIHMESNNVDVQFTALAKNNVVDWAAGFDRTKYFDPGTGTIGTITNITRANPASVSVSLALGGTIATGDQVSIYQPATNVSNITAANPGQVTTTAPNTFSTGQVITMTGIVGAMGALLNGNSYTITVVDASNFTLGVDTTSGGTYSTGGKITVPYPGWLGVGPYSITVTGANTFTLNGVDTSGFATAYPGGMGAFGDQVNSNNVAQYVNNSKGRGPSAYDTLGCRVQAIPSGEGYFVDEARVSTGSWAEIYEATIHNADNNLANNASWILYTCADTSNAASVSNVAVAASVVTVTTAATHGFAVGNLVSFRSMSVTTQMEGKTYRVATTPTATSFTLDIITGAGFTTGAGTGNIDLRVPWFTKTGDTQLANGRPIARYVASASKNLPVIFYNATGTAVNLLGHIVIGVDGS